MIRWKKKNKCLFGNGINKLYRGVAAERMVWNYALQKSPLQVVIFCWHIHTYIRTYISHITTSKFTGHTVANWHNNNNNKHGLKWGWKKQSFGASSRNLESHQRRLLISRHKANLVWGGDGGAGGARRPGWGQCVPGVVATRRRVGHLNPWALAAFLGVGHPGF